MCQLYLIVLQRSECYSCFDDGTLQMQMATKQNYDGYFIQWYTHHQTCSGRSWLYKIMHVTDSHFQVVSVVNCIIWAIIGVGYAVKFQLWWSDIMHPDFSAVLYPCLQYLIWSDLPFQFNEWCAAVLQPAVPFLGSQRHLKAACPSQAGDKG